MSGGCVHVSDGGREWEHFIAVAGAVREVHRAVLSRAGQEHEGDVAGVLPLGLQDLEFRSVGAPALWRKALGGGCADSGGGNARVVADLIPAARDIIFRGSKGKSPDGADEEEGDVNFGGLDLDLETEARECLHSDRAEQHGARKI